jgi:hypothetical protein
LTENIVATNKIPNILYKSAQFKEISIYTPESAQRTNILILDGAHPKTGYNTKTFQWLS